MAELMYGIRSIDRKIISIDEVPDNMSGLACNCVCVSCGQKLQACSLQGKVRRYFRHHYDTRDGVLGRENWNCNSNTANETALHSFAKQIIAEEKKVLVPHKTISLSEAGIIDLPQKIKNQVSCFVFQKSKVVFAETVELEKRLEGFTPDVIVRTKRGDLLVEIFVSHKVGEEKKTKAQEFGAAMMEIDLSRFVETPISSNKLREIIMDSEENKKWIHYPLSAKAIAQAKKYYADTEVVKQYYKAIQEDLEKQRREEKNRERRNEKIKHLFQQEIYAAELKSLRDDASFMDFYKKHSKPHWYSFDKHYQEKNQVPFFVDIPITGEMIFRCDRRIWQSTLFNRYIYGRKNEKARFNVEDIFDVLRDDYKIEVDFDLTYKLTNPLDKERFVWLRRDVVNQYVDYLETIDFIGTPNDSKKQSKWKIVKTKKTIVPPDKRAAERLASVLREVDQYSPNIDKLVDEKISECDEKNRNKELKEHQFVEQNQCRLETRSKLGYIPKEEMPQLSTTPNFDSDLCADTFEAPFVSRPIKDYYTQYSPEGLKTRKRVDTHRLEVQHMFGQRDQEIRDSEGKRWLKCVCCGEWKREKAFLFFDFEKVLNSGICIMCYHQNRTPKP